jgi:hypothetical protein
MLVMAGAMFLVCFGCADEEVTCVLCCKCNIYVYSTSCTILYDEDDSTVPLIYTPRLNVHSVPQHEGRCDQEFDSNCTLAYSVCTACSFTKHFNCLHTHSQGRYLILESESKEYVKRSSRFGQLLLERHCTQSFSFCKNMLQDIC